MQCPHCNDKLYVVEIVHDKDLSDTYSYSRKLKCHRCGFVAYTIEFENGESLEG